MEKIKIQFTSHGILCSCFLVLAMFMFSRSAFATTEISVTTIIEDGGAQPIYAGGYIANYVKENIIKKGIIVSISSEDMFISDDTQFYGSDLMGWWGSHLENIKYIDCTNINEEQFICAIKFLKGNTDYYLRSFVIDTNNKIIYGGIEKIHTKNYNRYDGPADYANVFRAFSYTLFDLVSDEIINPNDGFYYTTNENPTTVKYQKGTSYNSCYKFATEWNYRLWYYHVGHSVESKRVSLPIMKYRNGKVEISKAEADNDKDITIYYSINGDGSRPENFTQIYTSPLTVNENSIVYCYAISSEGYISYTNRYVVRDIADNNKYLLTYILDGEIYKSYEIDFNTPITPEPIPSKEGYTFSGWSDIPETMPAHDVIVTGSFIVNSYTLTYKVDGNVYKTKSVAYGSAITPEPAPTKEGHTFSGWTGLPEKMPAHNVEVVGSFTINNYPVIYMVDGEEYARVEIEYGAAITPLEAPTKEGYTFSGWSYIPPTMPAADVVAPSRAGARYLRRCRLEMLS